MYSRKVEFLYNLVFETLELLSKQRKAKGENTKEKGLVHQVMDDPVVVLDSSIFGERSIIDLKAGRQGDATKDGDECLDSSSFER